MEVTQGLQNIPAPPAFGDVQLLEDKVTWVRVYPWIDFDDADEGAYVHQDHVTLRLRGYRNGVELPGSPLEPATPELTVRQVTRRSFIDRTFNFLLPASWRSGSIDLEAEIDPDHLVPETDELNNSFSGSFLFRYTKPFCPVYVPVEVPEGIAGVEDTDMDDILRLLKILWPTSRVYTGMAEPISQAGGPYEAQDDAAKILNKLEWVSFWAQYPESWCESFTGQTHFIGVLEPTGGDYLGYGRYNVPVSWTQKLTWQPNFDSDTLDYYEETFGTRVVPTAIPRAAGIVAQELGHNYGRYHVDCGDPQNVDPDYPYDPESFFEETQEGHWGFDHRRIGSPLYEQWAIVRSETAAEDFMSYCTPSWVSDYTYNAILERSSGSLSGGGAGVVELDLFTPLDQILTVSALLFPGHDDGDGDAEPVAEITAVRLLPGKTFSTAKLRELDHLAAQLRTEAGDWSLDLIGPFGTLASYAFEPQPFLGGHHAESAILLPVRFVKGTERIEITHDGQVIASRRASANAPKVKVISPNGDEVLPAGLVVRWESDDVDGDELLHDVQYSPDQGESWYVVATDLPGQSYALKNLNSLPGSDGRALVRVVASDGVHSSVDTSDRPFTLGMRSPRVYITSPRTDEVLSWGQLTVLSGGANDAEDGALDASRLSWLVDDEPAGIGAEVTVSGLAVGKHTATLRALDSRQAGGVATVDFWIARAQCPPVNDRLEIVWLVEVSSLMELHEAQVCAQIPIIVADLQKMGLNVRSEVLTVLGGNDCSKRDVRSIDAGTRVKTGTDMHHAIASVAAHWSWGDGTRVISPILKYLASDPSSEDTSILGDAVQAARSAGVHVAPWLLPLVDGGPAPALRQPALALASATGGTVLEWGSIAIPAELFSIKFLGDCAPQVDGSDWSGTVDPANPRFIFGRHLLPDLQVQVDGLPAREVSVSSNGRWLSFLLPLGVEPGREHAVVLGRPGKPTVAVGKPILVADPVGPTDGGRFRRGDSNGDLKVDVSDAVFTLGYLFSGGASPRCADAADANDDAKVDISDPIGTLGYLFLGGAAPPRPGPSSCGEDPTTDGLPPCRGDCR